MAAYLIVQIEITNPQAYELVKKLTPPTIKKFGGKYLARGRIIKNTKGKGERLVILEFEDIKQAKAWWNSSEYAPVKELRQLNAITNMVLTEGFPGF